MASFKPVQTYDLVLEEDLIVGFLRTRWLRPGQECYRRSWNIGAAMVQGELAELEEHWWDLYIAATMVCRILLLKIRLNCCTATLLPARSRASLMLFLEQSTFPISQNCLPLLTPLSFL